MDKRALFRDYDALAFRRPQLEKGAVNHVKKVHKKRKGEEILFDPKAHKDYLTGFRKRKQQRRREAIENMEIQQKKQRVEERAERRTKMKEELGLPEDYGVASSSSDEEPEQPAELAAHSRAEVRVYKQGDTTTTVSVVALDPDPDEAREGQEDDAGGDAGRGGSEEGDDDAAGPPGGAQPEHGGAPAAGGRPGRKAHKQQVQDRDEMVKRQQKRQMLHRLKAKQQGKSTKQLGKTAKQSRGAAKAGKRGRRK